MDFDSIKEQKKFNHLNKSKKSISIKEDYEVREEEIERLKEVMSNNSELSFYEKSALNYYIATYYYNLSNLYEKYNTDYVLSNKVKREIFFEDDSNLVEYSVDDVIRKNRIISDLSAKANGYFNIAEREIKNILNHDDILIMSLYYHIKINTFFNLSNTNPLLCLLLIEDFEKHNKVRIDLYNSVMLNTAYCTAFQKFKEFANNGPDILRSIVKINCDFRLNQSMYYIKNLVKEGKKELFDQSVELVGYINKLSTKNVDVDELKNKDIKALELNVRLLKDSYEEVLKHIIENRDIIQFGNSKGMKDVFEELACNIVFYNSEEDYHPYEKKYRVSEAYNIIDKISYALIEYISENKKHEKDWAFKYLLEKEVLQNYSEPNFRCVLSFINIINNFNDNSYFDVYGSLTKLRHDTTHKPIEPVDEEEAEELNYMKRMLNIFNVTYILLAITAIDIDKAAQK